MAAQPSPLHRSEGKLCLCFEEGIRRCLTGRQGSTFHIQESSLSRWDPCYPRIAVAPGGGLMLQNPRVPPRPRRALPCPQASLRPGLPLAAPLAVTAARPHNPACQGLIARSPPLPSHPYRHLRIPGLPPNPGSFRPPHSSQQELSDVSLLFAPDPSQPHSKALQNLLPRSPDLSTAIPHDPSDNAR